MVFGTLLLVLLVGGVVVAIVVSRSHRPAAPVGTPAGAGAPRLDAPHLEWLDGWLRRWVDAGLISKEQATAIESHERVPARPEPTLFAVEGRAPALRPAPAPAAPRRIPAVAEALGYLGGALAAVGLGLIVSRYWEDLATAGRLTLAGVVALALAGAGLLVREGEDPALDRLRWTLWTASTAAAALFAGVLAADGLDVDVAATVAITAGAVAAWSTLLRWWRQRPLQQATFLGGVLVAIGGSVAVVASSGPTGLAVWGAAAVLVGLGLWRRTPLPPLTEGAGAIGTVVGAIFVASTWQTFGLPLLVATSAGLLALALVRGAAPERADQVLFGVVGTFALWNALPGSIGYFAEGAGIATGLIVWAAGAGLVLIGARRLVRLPGVVEAVGGIALLGGAAVTGVQSVGFATLFGLATALALVALGMLPGRFTLSLLGSAGLLAYVPWSIAHFFPGEDRAPVLVLAAGAVIVAVAVLLTRRGQQEHRHRHGPQVPGSGPASSGPAAPTAA